MTAIGVLCARVRVEEKQIIAAIGEAGFVAVPVPPASTPLPPGPASGNGAMLGEFLGATAETSPDVLVDRVTNRAVAAATLPLLRTFGLRTLDAGIAATGTRLQVASALSLAGVARPEALVGFSEESAVAAAEQLGYPSTLFGQTPGSASTMLLDADTADAVIEHRVVLGEASEAIMLIQVGAPAADQRAVVHVVGGRSVAASGSDLGSDALLLAEEATRALQASLVAIEIAVIGGNLVVWDVHPVHDFRQAHLTGSTTVAEAIAQTAVAHSRAAAASSTTGEVTREYALSA